MRRGARGALIGAIASKRDALVTSKSSRLAAEMPHAFDVRVQAFVPPIADYAIMLRKHAAQVIPADSYRIAKNSTRHSTEKPPCDARRLEAWYAAIERGDNIIYAGAIGSGKTTILGSGLGYAAKVRLDARLVVIQDRKEVKYSFPRRVTFGYVRAERSSRNRPAFNFRCSKNCDCFDRFGISI